MEATSSHPNKTQSNIAIELHWPTDYYVVTQAFNANPELHSAQNLPGHEGLDIRAPLNSPVYACAPGEVVEVHDRADGHPYGRYVSMLHQNGYRTTYGHLSKVVVNRGQKVKAGDQIALAGPTGQTGGGHIRLTLRQDGATAAGLTHFFNDVIDPTPFLSPPVAPDGSKYAWPLGRCLMGINAPPNGTSTDTDLTAAKRANVEAVKLSLQTDIALISKLKKINPAFFLLTQLRLPFDDKRISAGDWVARVRPAFKQHVDAGVSYFEVGHAPNLYSAGCYLSWTTGAEFGHWWLDVVNGLKVDVSQARFGIPAPMPGGSITGQRMDEVTFLEGADEMMLSADWIGVPCTWSTEAEMLDDNKGRYYSTMRRYYPNQVLFITEFGNINPAQSDQEIQNFYKKIAQVPGIGAAFASA